MPHEYAEKLVADPSLAGAVRRAERLVLVLARRPLTALLGVLALNLALAGIGVVTGLVLLDDHAKYFRELAPGTWLSCGQLLLIAAAVWAVHTRTEGDTSWWRSFWGLSAAIFVVFAFDEITQFTIFAADALERGFGARPSAGFHDVQAVLLTLLFVSAALILLPRALVLLRHPLALALGVEQQHSSSLVGAFQGQLSRT